MASQTNIRLMQSSVIPSYDEVLTAHERIKSYIHKTPLLTSQYLDQLTGTQLFFKCENFQKTGAFKARGATNAVFSLSANEAKRGVATHSSGNHGMALSFAAQQRGIPATVVMPHTAPQVKRDAVRAYGGTIVECEPSSKAREAALSEVVNNTDAVFVHPYNDARVITGQATCSLELLQQSRNLDAVIAPIGGGGMISGTCLALSKTAPKTSVFAAEPVNADDAARSLKAGQLITDDAPNTIADGLKVPLKELTWHFVKNHVTDILTTTEKEIIEAMTLIWQRMKIVVEPSSAVPLAAIIKNSSLFSGKRVGVILTGGNVDLNHLPWVDKVN